MLTTWTFQESGAVLTDRGIAEREIMNIHGYGSGSFVDIMNSSHKRNQIPLVNQIVSYKDTENGEIYRAYFTDDKVTSHNAVGQKAWETAIKDASHVQKIKESLGGITLYSHDNSTGKKALSSVGFPNGESISVFEADDFSKETPIYMVKHWDENGVESEYTINPNEVDPEHASYLEMAAYATYLDTTGQAKDAFGDFVGTVNGVNEESVADVMHMTDKKDFLDMIYGYMQMQYDTNNLEGYLSLKNLYDCMTGGEEYEC